MGSKKYLLLTPDELQRVLKAFGFVRKRTRGDHEQWEGMTNEKRRVITVQLISGEYSIDRMKTIIQNMDITADEFYGQDESIAKRYFGKK
ncbi:MAG: type II toxin-antitoxin system HicA family toxin [Nitrospira sp.]|nr:type II toxin-antitoxin system HicA family toxin [Nitrospira sp.]